MNFQKNIWITIFVSLITLIPVFSQSDTLHFPLGSTKIYEYLRATQPKGTSEYLIEGVVMNQEEYNELLPFKDSMNSISNNFYCKFYIGGVLSEEGKYWKGVFIGPYKQYYPNGNIKMEGILSDNFLRVGEWKYYKSNGELKKVINHDIKKKHETVDTKPHEWFLDKVEKTKK